MKKIGAAAGIALGAIGFALKGSVDEAIKFESAMADVKIYDLFNISHRGLKLNRFIN